MTASHVPEMWVRVAAVREDKESRHRLFDRVLKPHLLCYIFTGEKEKVLGMSFQCSWECLFAWKAHAEAGTPRDMSLSSWGAAMGPPGARALLVWATLSQGQG